MKRLLIYQSVCVCERFFLIFLTKRRNVLVFAFEREREKGHKKKDDHNNNED